MLICVYKGDYSYDEDDYEKWLSILKPTFFSIQESWEQAATMIVDTPLW